MGITWQGDVFRLIMGEGGSTLSLTIITDNDEFSF